MVTGVESFRGSFLMLSLLPNFVDAAALLHIALADISLDFNCFDGQ